MIESTYYSGNPEEDYPMALAQVKILIQDEPNLIANLANVSALLNQCLGDINWVGFYLVEPQSNQLVLGPFQGLPACIRINLGKGVCGTAGATRRVQHVEDVHQFPGHIACDSRSNAEVVVPLVKNDQLLGVLDVDSPTRGRFTQMDVDFLVQVAAILVEHWG